MSHVNHMYHKSTSQIINTSNRRKFSLLSQIHFWPAKWDFAKKVLNNDREEEGIVKCVTGRLGILIKGI